MKLTAKVKLVPTPEQSNALKRTLETANAACNYISECAWEHQAFRQFPLQKITYYSVRKAFPLTAQLVVRCISKVADVYKADTKAKRTFLLLGAIAFDNRILRWYVDKSEVSIWTVDGRQHLPFVCGPRQRELLQGQRGESDLCYIDGQMYLFATCDVETPEPTDVDSFLGVDLGIKNIAVDSDGNIYSGSKVNSLRHRHARLRAKLQSKGTKSAKRLLKKRRCTEQRFANDVNHIISKELVQRAKDTSRGIALENLQGIRKRVTVRKTSRRTHYSWSFFDLRIKIEYKAKLAGVPVEIVNPRNTSRTCPICGCIDKANRPSQSVFLCVQCNFSGFADHIAAGIIASRGAVMRPNAATLAG